MHIKKLQLQQFKRFTDLTIDLGNQEIAPKLVLLIGANGSGKSSIMDAMQSVYDYASKGRRPNESYAHKGGSPLISIQTDQGEISYGTGKTIGRELAKKIYTRPSIRMVPEIKGGKDAADDGVRRSIDFERRFDNDVVRFVNLMIQQMGKAVSGESDGVAKIREEIIAPFNQSLKRIFGLEDDICLQFNRFEAPGPQTPANLQFAKGSSQIDFTSLSHGEKQIIIILLNFMMRKNELEDTIIYIDEMDVHLHTSLQYNLIQEIVEYRLPDNSQLWTASHALGFIDYAKASHEAVIIDFDNLNFDYPHLLIPEESEIVYDIAVPQSMLSTIFAGKEIILCENKNSVLFAYLERENTVFVPANNKAGVLNQSKANKLQGIIDRDFLTDVEREGVRNSFGVIVLEYYCLENYLYHPDNLEAYYAITGAEYDKELYIQGLVDQKNISKEDIKLSKVKSARDGYMIFKQTHECSIARSSEKEIGEHLDSDVIEIFLKSFSLKDFAKQLPARQNISQHNLMKTDRMKDRIHQLIG